MTRSTQPRICKYCGKPEEIVRHGHGKGIEFTNWARHADCCMDCLPIFFAQQAADKAARWLRKNDSMNNYILIVIVLLAGATKCALLIARYRLRMKIWKESRGTDD